MSTLSSFEKIGRCCFSLALSHLDDPPFCIPELPEENMKSPPPSRGRRGIGRQQTPRSKNRNFICLGENNNEESPADAGLEGSSELSPPIPGAGADLPEPAPPAVPFALHPSLLRHHFWLQRGQPWHRVLTFIPQRCTVLSFPRARRELQTHTRLV